MTERREEGSQLSTFQRFRLYARRPDDVLAIVSTAERRSDAQLACLIYVVVKAPVLVQRAVALGIFERLSSEQAVQALILGLGCGVLAGALVLLVEGLLVHVIVNVGLEAGRPRSEALWLPALCLAPQWILAIEFPSLLFDFGARSTYLTLLVLRLLADVLSLRMFYWGLRLLLGASRRAALVLSIGPVAVVVWLSLR